MSFRWAYLDHRGAETGTSESFGSREQAEDWMGAEWRRLLDGGTLLVALMDGDQRVYSMKLTED